MKEKISITLDDEIVKKIEKIAGEQNINRSKFIEKILMEKLENTPILILAGWSDVKGQPKSLIKHNNKRLIVTQIENLKNSGLTNIYVALSSKELRKYLEDNFPEVHIIFEEKKLGSGGTLKLFAKQVKSRFLFMHCDILFDLNLNKLIDFHIQERTDLTLALKSMKNPSKYGTATIEGKKIVDFKEKPKTSDIYLIYIGIGVAEPKALENLEEIGKFELQLEKIKNKIGYIYEGYWKDIDTN